MFCSKCGKENNQGANFCRKCGQDMHDSRKVASNQYQSDSINNNIKNKNLNKQVLKNTTPKCNHCGHIGAWKVEPIIRPVDWCITLGLLIFFGAGLIYFLVVLIIRSNQSNRSKICTQCKAKNMFTFVY